MPILARRPSLRETAPPPRAAPPAVPAAPPFAGPAPVRPPAGRYRSAASRSLSWGLKSVAGVLAATVVGGIALRLTVRDGYAPLAPTFYALSVPVLTLLGLAAALAGAMSVGLRLTVKRGLTLGAFGLIAAANATVFLYDVTFDDRPRVVVWNVARGAAGWANVADALEANHPTLAVLVESGEDEAADAFWRERFGDQFFVERPGAGITVLSRGPISGVELVRLPNCGDGFAVRTKTQLGGERIAALAVDMPSNPKVDRGPAMRHVVQLARELAADRPTLVAGDFNTPPESVHFEALRRAGFVHAFERHGRGYAATWPVPAPVLHLDHLWLSPGFDVGEVSHGWTSRSDHRPVLAPTRVAPAEYAAYQPALRNLRAIPEVE